MYVYDAGQMIGRASIRARRGMVRRAALAAAAMLLTGAIGLAVWSAVSGRAPTRPTGADIPAPTIMPEGVAASPSSRPTVGTVEDLLGGTLGASDEGRLEFVDETGRVVRELVYARLEPGEGGRVAVTSPEAWVRLDSGAVVRLTARSANLLQPAGRREPESGRFTGDVRVRFYESDPRGERGSRAEPSATPILEVRTDSLNFDMSLAEARTADPVRVEAAGVAVGFTGFRLVLDETRDRLAFFETRSAGTAAFDFQAMRAARDRESIRTESNGDPRRRAGVETLYSATIEGEIIFDTESLRATAGRLDALARLIDGALTPATIDSFAALRTDNGDAAERADGGDSGDGSRAVSLAWSRGLTVRAADETPFELTDEDVYVRLAGEQGGVVRLRDSASGLDTTSVGVEARAVGRRLVWSGLGPTGVVVRGRESFEAVTGLLDVDLKSGLVLAPGPGEIRRLTPGARAADSPRVARISWRDNAASQLARTPDGVDLAAVPLVRTADFVGGVEAIDGPTRVSGDRLGTVFAASADGATALSRAVVTGSARVDAGADGALAADRLDIEFDTKRPGAATPTVATAHGRVRAERDGATLVADLAEARLRAGAGGRLVVESFTAELGVRVNTADGVVAEAAALRASPEIGLVDLTGTPASVAQGADVILGDSIRLEETTRRLSVLGAGSLERSDRENSIGYEFLRLTWQDSFVYDDIRGQAEALGQCVLNADLADLGRDTVTAATLTIDTLPAEVRAVNSGQSPIRRAVATGGSGGTNPRDPARVESRRYAADPAAPGGLRLTQLVALDSPVIEYDAIKDRLLAPRPGRLVLEDRRGEIGDAELAPGVQTRGTTLVEWDGWLDLRRADGSVEFRRQVRVRHRPPAAARVTDLECERLEIAFSPAGAGSAGGGVGWGQASGAVYIAQGRRQVIADRLLYDATLGFAELTASAGNLVTMFDADVPTPLLGEHLRWDLVRDRVEWRGARPAAAPD